MSFLVGMLIMIGISRKYLLFLGFESSIFEERFELWLWGCFRLFRFDRLHHRMIFIHIILLTKSVFANDIDIDVDDFGVIGVAAQLV